MPIVNGAYDAPTWNNNAPPAIDASELQDMCDTIETYNTQKADVDYVNTFVRPNLLDNAYFVGGGSQQGGGQFPINQRGATSYSTANAYTIDRWYCRSANSNISVGSDGITLSTASASQAAIIFDQPVDDALQITRRGKTITSSILVTAISGATFSFQDVGGSCEISSPGLYSVTRTVSDDYSSDYSVRVFNRAGTNPSITIAALKQELGSTQTLAHWDGSEWVLNEIPNYQEELAKCQRYQIRVGYNSNSSYASPAAFGYAVSSTAFRAFFPLPVTMRTSPTIEYFNSETMDKFVITGHGQSVSPSTVSSIAYESGVMVLMTVSGLSTNYMYSVKLNTTDGIMFTANL